MSREQAKEFIQKTFGIEEVSDEQISAYLNNLNGAIKTEKDRADKLKADAELVDSLKAQLEEVNNKNLTDVEKANKETEKANAMIASLQTEIKAMQTKAKLAELGIVGESADAFFAEDGSVDFAILGQIISEREQKASSLKEKEILANTPNPKGGHKTDDKTEAEKIAESIGKTMANESKASNDVLSQYLN